MNQILGLIVPLFAVIALGHFAERLKFLDANSSASLNGFAYWVALPSLLFVSMARLQAGGELSGVALIYLACCLAIYAFSMTVSTIAFKRSFAEASMFALNATYGNVVYFGIPLVTAAFEPASLPIILAIVAVHSAVLLPGTAILIEVGSESSDNGLKSIQRVATQLLQNPIVMSIFAGLLWRLTNLDLPLPLLNTFTFLGGAAAPLALFCLGASLPAAAITLLSSAEVVVAVIIKLALLPIVLGVAGWQLGVEEAAWKVAILTAAVPTGANANLMARSRSVLTDISGAIVVFATGASALTIGALLYWLR
jgi:malonate transporter